MEPVEIKIDQQSNRTAVRLLLLYCAAVLLR